MFRASGTATVPRQLLRGLGWAALAATAALALAIALPLAFGARPQTVLTGSMEPAISPGDVTVDESISPADAEVGDVVAFRDPEDQDRVINHRVVSVRPARDGLHYWFVTQGDANNSTERWRIESGGRVGRVLYTVPWVGHLAALTSTGLGLAALLLVPLLLLGVDELARIWRAPTRRTAP